MPGGEVEHLPFDSDRALLDADIVIFEPTLGVHLPEKTYKGKPSFDENSSFRIQRHLAHWRTELRECLDAGKLVVVFLSRPVNVFFRTGEETITGTGLDMQRVNIVKPASSYDAIPRDWKVRTRSGREISPAGDLGFLATYWTEFGPSSAYEVTLTGEFTHPLLKTRTGTSLVGAAMVSGALVEIRKTLRSNVDATPPPEWAHAPEYELPQETRLYAQILDCAERIEELRAQRSTLDEDLREAGTLRALLYARGKNSKPRCLRRSTFSDSPRRTSSTPSRSSMENIRHLASTFRTSLSSSAIRYCSFTGERCAVVFSKDNEIQWSAASKDFSYDVLRFGDLDPETYAADAFSGKALPTEMRTAPLEAWIEDEVSVRAVVQEDSMPMPKLNAVLTLLWLEEAYEDEEGDY